MARLITIVRATVALLLTVAVLPYAWARTAVMTMIVGWPEWQVSTLLLAAFTVTAAITFHLAKRFESARTRRMVWFVAFSGWLVTNVAILVLQAGGNIGLVTIIALYVPSTLWLLWAAWMFYGSLGWRTRCGVLLVLCLLPAGLFWLVEADGMMGDTRIQFAWRELGPPLTQTAAASVRSTLPASAAARSAGLDYPQFLGPERNAVVRNARLSRDWKRNPPRVVWKKEVGGGWSAFAIDGHRAITHEQRDDDECVVCYALATGEELWTHRDAKNFSSSMGGPGPRATPTIHQGLVYALGGTGLLNCLDAADGKPVWSVDIMADNEGQGIAHGVCSSPLIVGETVIVCPTGRDDRSLVAYDRKDGQRLWRAGAHGQSYSSPVEATIAGVPQLLLFTYAGLDAHDTATGKLLWSFPWQNTTSVNVSQPIVHAGAPDRVFISTGYAKGCALLQVRSAPNNTFVADRLKTSREMKTKFTTPVLHEGHVYGLDDGILQCIELETLKERWKAGRYGHGQILLAGDLLIVQAEQGDVALVEPSPEKLIELGRTPALEGKTWNNPALSGEYLLVRNDREAACLELPLEGD